MASIRAWPGNLTASHAMVTGHLGMVLQLARQLTNGGGEEQFRELAGEGEVALCEAVPEFVADRPGCRFSTYAHRRIHRAMVSWLRQDGVVKSGEWQARQEKEARSRHGRLVSLMGQAPTREEFAYVYGVPLGQSLRDGPALIGLDQTDELEAQEEGPDWFQGLPMTTRALLRQLTAGATLGQVAVEWGEDRDVLLGLLSQARQALP